MHAGLANVSPYIRVAHNFVVEKGALFERAVIVDHALHYFKDGNGVYTVGTEQMPIRPGSLFLIRPGVSFTFRAHPGVSFHMFNLHFDVVETEDSRRIAWPYPQPEDVPREAGLCRIPDVREAVEGAGAGHAADAGMPALPTVVPLVETAAYEQIFFRILYRFGKRDAVSVLQSKAALLELLALLCRQPELKRTAASPGQANEVLEAAVSYMQLHLHERIALEQIAQAVHVSKSYLFKCFHNGYRLSPMKFLTRLRIERAKWELLHTAKPIKQIAADTGFEGIHSFYHAFGREAGVSPGAFRTHAQLSAKPE